MKKSSDKKLIAKKPIYKRIWFWILILILIIGISNSNKPNVTKVSTSSKSTATTKVATAVTKKPDVTKKPKIEYDALKKVFLNVSYDTTEDDIKAYIQKYGLEFTAQNYNGTPKELIYKIGYDKKVVLQKYADSGDYLQIKFNRENGDLMYADYYNQSISMCAMLFNYGNYFDLHQKTPQGENSGFYYFKPGQSYNKCKSAEQAIELMYTYKDTKKKR